MRFNFGGSAYTGGNYVYAMNFMERSSGANNGGFSGGWNINYIPLSNWSGDGSAEHYHAEALFIRPWDTSNRAKAVQVQGSAYDSGNLYTHNHSGYLDGQNYNVASTGITVLPGSGSFIDLNWELYGIK